MGFTGLAWRAQTALASMQGETEDKGRAIRELKQLEARERNVGLQLQARKADAASRLLAGSGR